MSLIRRNTLLVCIFFDWITHWTVFLIAVFPMCNYLSRRSTMGKLTLTTRCTSNHVFQNTFHYIAVGKIALTTVLWFQLIKKYSYQKYNLKNLLTFMSMQKKHKLLLNQFSFFLIIRLPTIIR